MDEDRYLTKRWNEFVSRLIRRRCYGAGGGAASLPRSCVATAAAVNRMKLQRQTVASWLQVGAARR